MAAAANTGKVAILGGARTPIGSYGGALAELPAHELGAVATRAALEAVPVTIYDPPSATVERIQSVVRFENSRKPVSLIVVDYLQLMRGESKRSNRNEELTEISAGLKNMASALGVPILVCAQLNRQAAGADNPQPRLSQFRDSGSIEADADVAILLHRRDEKAPKNEPMAVDLLVEKNRTGACGAVGMSFVGKFQRFYPEGQNDE